MREMKDSGIEWIKQIPTGWTTTRGKNILQLMKRPPEADDEVITCFRNGEVTLRRNRREEGFTFSDKEIGYQGIKKGDLVIHGMDGFAGAIGISDSDGKGSPVLVVCTTKENARYLVYYLRTLAMQDVFLALATGIRERSCDLRWNKIADLLFPVPELDEQCRIADYLDRKCSQIDAIIARQQEVIEKLKAYKLSVITEAVAKGLNPDVPMKDSGVEWIGKIPEHWMMLKLKYASSILRGKFNHRPRNDPAYYDGNHPFVQTGDVARANKYIKNYSQTLNEKGYAVSKEFPANSICMTIAANVGDVAILTFDACFPDSVVGFVPSSNITWNYLYYVLTAMKKQFVRNAIISTQLNLNIEIIKEEFIPVAPLRIQKQISKFLDDKCLAIDRTISAKQSVIDKLKNYRKSLIYEVVTGKKEV